MPKLTYNKLVRDKIPEIIKLSGKSCTTHIASSEEFAEALVKKLGEEAVEFTENPCVEEVADMLEVIDSLCAQFGWDMDDILRVKETKKQSRGGFEKGIILEYTE